MRLRSGVNDKALARKLIGKALVNLDSSGIVGSSPVTAWNNSGTGGSGYNFDVTVGTVGSITTSTRNGHTVISNEGGNKGLETSTGGIISAPMTVFYVAAQTTLNGNFTGAKSDSTKALNSGYKIADAKFQAEAGTELQLAATSDTDWHVWTIQHNGDTTSKLTVSGLGSITGSMGAEDWEIGTIMQNDAASSPAVGLMGQLLVFSRALTATEIVSIQNYLSAKFSI